MSPVSVISQQPPGGRCTLYARYAKAIAEMVGGGTHRIVHSDCRNAHGDGFPSLWVGDIALQPADGVILSPEDICAHLARQGTATERLEGLRSRLTTILDDFLETWNP